jgi:hypothetical protein
MAQNSAKWRIAANGHIDLLLIAILLSLHKDETPKSIARRRILSHGSAATQAKRLNTDKQELGDIHKVFAPRKGEDASC